MSDLGLSWVPKSKFEPWALNKVPGFCCDNRATLIIIYFLYKTFQFHHLVFSSFLTWGSIEYQYFRPESIKVKAMKQGKQHDNMKMRGNKYPQ